MVKVFFDLGCYFINLALAARVAVGQHPSMAKTQLGAGGKTSASHRRTKFLVVVDDTPEARVALRYASYRARNVGGSVMLFRAIAPADSQHFLAVEEIMAQEAHEAAQTLLSDFAAQVKAASGIVPELAIREGHTRDELLALIDSDPDIRILVLAAAPGHQGPGPLVSALAGQMSGGLRIPITVVPGSLTDAQIEELT